MSSSDHFVSRSVIHWASGQGLKEKEKSLDSTASSLLSSPSPSTYSKHFSRSNASLLTRPHLNVPYFLIKQRSVQDVLLYEVI